MTASWAAIAKAAPAPAIPAAAGEGHAFTGQTVVLDANVMISGTPLSLALTERVVTIPEVLEEVRDKQSRQAVESLPFKITTLEPSDESLSAVMRFARDTGELNSLSKVDIKLLALVHTLEVAARGSDHLPSKPAPPRLHSKGPAARGQLPGWGDDASHWAALDHVPDPDARGAGSKLSETVLPVPDNVSSEEQDGLCDLQQPDGDAQSGISAPGEGAQGAPGGPRTELEGPQMHGADGEVGRGVDMTSSQGAPATEGDESGEGEWEVAARSGMAARRRRRRARRYAAASAFPSEAEPVAESDARQTAADKSLHVDGPPGGSVFLEEEGGGDEGAAAGGEDAPATRGADSPCVTGLAAGAGEAGEKGNNLEAGCGGEREGKEPDCVPAEEGAGIEGRGGGGGKVEEEVEGEAASEEDAGEDEESEAEGEGYSEDELESEGEDDVITGAEGGEAGQEARKQGHAEGGRSGVGGTEVVCITGDRAMQNVLLQMGLGLRAPSGQRVTSMRTFVLRCTACTRISHEAGRLFCERCGAAGLDKVELLIGADGVAQYGIRKKHVLKGTRFSLPKPKGGRNAGNPILREDQLLMMRRGPRSGQPRKGSQGVDPFAPEYGPDTWYHSSHPQGPSHSKGAAFVTTGWHNNPNERKNVRTNRRG